MLKTTVKFGISQEAGRMLATLYEKPKQALNWGGGGVSVESLKWTLRATHSCSVQRKSPLTALWFPTEDAAHEDSSRAVPPAGGASPALGLCARPEPHLQHRQMEREEPGPLLLRKVTPKQTWHSEKPSPSATRKLSAKSQKQKKKF